MCPRSRLECSGQTDLAQLSTTTASLFESSSSFEDSAGLWTPSASSSVLLRGRGGGEGVALVYGFEEMEACRLWLPVSRNTPPTLSARWGEGTQGPRTEQQALRGRRGHHSLGHVRVSLFFWPHPDGFSLSPSLLPTVAHEHLKERGLFGLPPPGTNPSDYYHQMTLMAGHPAPYGDLLMQSGGAASAPHLHDYLNPVDGECWAPVGAGSGTGAGG